MSKNPADILAEMADTFRERNKVYGNNYKSVGDMMTNLFPDGVILKTREEFNRWHLFQWIVIKITRLVNSGLLHKDSIHDIAVYAAMLESMTEESSTPIGGKHE